LNYPVAVKFEGDWYAVGGCSEQGVNAFWLEPIPAFIADHIEKIIAN